MRILAHLKERRIRLLLILWIEKFARWAAKNIGKKFKALVVQNDGVCIAKLDDEIKGADIILYDTRVNLLENVEVQIMEADIVMAKNLC